MDIRGVIAAVLLALAPAGSALAVPSGMTVTYEGGGAGQVVFDGTLHAAKGYSCAVCHEGHVFSLPWFAKKKGGDVITMKAITEGWSCGHCHVVSMQDTLSCEKCHRKH